MAYPASRSGLANHGYHSDRDSYPHRQVSLDKVQLQMGQGNDQVQYSNPDYSIADQHDYEELPFNKRSIKAKNYPAPPSANLQSYTISNDDYTYSVGDPSSIASMPSNSSLNFERRSGDSRATSAISIIGEKPRKRENPLYDKVELQRPAVKPIKPESSSDDSYEISKKQFFVICVILGILIFLVVILLALVIYLFLSQSGNAQKEELTANQESVVELQTQVQQIDTTVRQLNSLTSGDVNDTNFLIGLLRNITRGQKDIEKVNVGLSDHELGAVANFTKLGKDINTLDENYRTVAGDVVKAGVEITKTDKKITDFLGQGLGNCTYKTSKTVGRSALKDTINSGKITETKDFTIMAMGCSVGGTGPQTYAKRFSEDVILQIVDHWCLCNGGASDNRVVYRECRVLAILCRNDPS